jgi:hypothetical protein
MILKKILEWHLQLLAEAGGGEGSGEGTQGADVAGQQADTSATEEGVATRTPDEEFADLINGQYKEQFHNHTQKIINQRFKETKNLEAQIERNRQINEAVALRYGLDPNDTEAILKSVNDDNSLYEDAAYEEGLTVEQYKAQLKGKQAIARLEAMEKAEQRKQAMQAIESEQNRIRQVYGDSAFDFWGEYNSNPEFRDLMDRRLPMETAYKVVNQQRMIENASKQAAANASKAVTNNILANGMRPVEGGIKTQPAVSTAIDVNNIKSLADIEKIYEMHGKRRS